MMFLIPAKVGYVCWQCGKDTMNFVSDSEYELCHECDQKYKADKFARANRIIELNNWYVEDLEEPPEILSKVKFRFDSFDMFITVTEWLNENIGRASWTLPTNPCKEMKNNYNRTTCWIDFFVGSRNIVPFVKKWHGNSMHFADCVHPGVIHELPDELPADLRDLPSEDIERIKIDLSERYNIGGPRRKKKEVRRLMLANR